MGPLRLVFDQHINARAISRLREDGVDVVHVAEVGLARADDATILAWAAERDRIVVTRNYRDFVPLVEAYIGQGRRFAGVLLFASSVRHSDVGHHLRALRGWIDRAVKLDRNPVRDGLGWLR